jgi:hypothetical protein
MASSVGLVAGAAVLMAWMTLPIQTAAQQEVDRTGLDILCKGKDKTYVPPAGGISMCINKKTGDVLVCDSKTDKCFSAIDSKGSSAINTDALMIYTLQQLTEKVDDLTKLVQALTARPYKQ